MSVSAKRVCDANPCFRAARGLVLDRAEGGARYASKTGRKEYLARYY